ncbi:Protein CBG03373 [Caenorhabditis briggsae]|uniref:Protein CBG03373 n=1 Tax=Caenorhabditis briggsae TaxID=6238 RepID=A8WUW2_CAEBR|nr:Protein CBG03373 [Caenorhabditis briggsae]CAP24274.2 Protein CBG03373 [Caenorhabditis briggsae]
MRNHDLAIGFNEEPFDNFRHFNDILKVEEENSCQPYVIGSRQFDLLELTAPMICVYTEIIKREELLNGTILVDASKNETNIEPGIPTRIDFEQFVVFCRDPSGYHFYNKTWFNFQPKLEKLEFRKSQKTDGLMVLIVTGMSHNQAMRHLKRTFSFASKHNFLSFSMFNQVRGFQEVLEMRTTKFQRSIDNWENSMKLFRTWRKPRCVTFLHSDSDRISKHFGDKFDFHSQLYNNFNRKYLGHVDNCITDGRVTVEDAVSLWVNSTKAFHNKKFCHFSLLHLDDIASPLDGTLVNLDEVLRDSFQDLFDEGILANTTIIVLSGGSKNSTVYKTESGKIESKYGLFLIRPSDRLRTKFPGKISSLSKNVDRLITDDDISETLLDLMTNFEHSEFQRSLFETELSSNRNCEDAGIFEDFCICSKRVELGKKTHLWFFRKEVMKSLLKLIRKEFSMFKCISKIQIDTRNWNVRKFGHYFFQFHGNLTTERIKESGRFSNSTVLKFHGTARFSTLAMVDLELKDRLKMEKLETKEKYLDQPFHL